MTKYRVVRDSYLGYEVQIKRIWFPFWIEAGTNTHKSINEAKTTIEELKKDNFSFSFLKEVVYLDSNN